ncbi:MAG: LPXTG-motif cell wall anchor protein [Nocardioidaceae bacterium]|nr:LPXTG-motif cell wall anchor protein [Nocardioidaceae bacterium]
MKRLIGAGLAAAVIAGGLGLSSGAQGATSSTSTTARVARAGLLPIDPCDLLPGLCDVPVIGPLLTDVADLLDHLLTVPPTGEQQAVADLVQQIQGSFAGLDPTQQSDLADGILTQLQGAGLSPAVLTEVLAQLSGLTDGTPALTQLVDDLVTVVQDLVEGLLGIGGETPDPTHVQALVTDVLDALATGNTSTVVTAVEHLITSLTGGDSLDPSVLTDLVNQLTAALQSVGDGLLPDQLVTIINQVTQAVDPDAPITGVPVTRSATPSISSPKANFTSTHPRISGVGVKGGSVFLRTKAGKVLGSAAVGSDGRWTLVSAKLVVKKTKYSVTATQVVPGHSSSNASAAKTFRVVSKGPVIATKSGKTFKTTRPTITGIAYPKTKVTLYSKGGKKLGSATVKADGSWKIKSKKLKKGTRTIKVSQKGHGKKKTTAVKKIKIT